MHASFAIPGDLATPTGGYVYARRLLREAKGAGVVLDHVALPDGFPTPDPTALGRTEEILTALPPDRPLLIDGLAYGALPVPLIRSIPCPVVALCHHPLALETGLDPALAHHLRAAETSALAEATRIVTTSHATAEILRQEFSVPGVRITAAPPGTDPAPRAPGSGDATCRILSVGSVTPRKGHVRLISALAPLSRLDWTLRIAGPLRDQDATAALRAAIDRSGLSDRISLLGPLSLPALTAAYQGADLFVLASEYEGFGMAFTEAMSHGLPTLGIASAAVEEATAGGACLVAPEDLSATLRLLIADPGTRLAQADKCWTAAQTFLRWPQTARIVFDVLREIKP